jgi:hypothetical protein
MIAAARAVSSLMGAVPSGSHVVIYHLANDLDPSMPAAARHWNKTTPKPITLRSRADILSLVSGLELVPPGVVPVTEWRPGLDALIVQEPSDTPAARSVSVRSAPARTDLVRSDSVRSDSVRSDPVPPVPVHGVVARKP